MASILSYSTENIRNNVIYARSSRWYASKIGISAHHRRPEEDTFLEICLHLPSDNININVSICLLTIWTSILSLMN